MSSLTLRLMRLVIASAAVVIGVVLIAFLCFFPHGVAGLVNRAWDWLRRVRADHRPTKRAQGDR